MRLGQLAIRHTSDAGKSHQTFATGGNRSKSNESADCKCGPRSSDGSQDNFHVMRGLERESGGQCASEVTMARGIAIAAKAVGTILLALAVVVFVWDYIAVHPGGPLLDYRVETAHGSAGAVVSV